MLATNLGGGLGEPKLCSIDLDVVERVIYHKLMGPWAKSALLPPREPHLPEGCGRKSAHVCNGLMLLGQVWSEFPVSLERR